MRLAPRRSTIARLVVYGRSAFCPDMHRWRQWVADHPLRLVEFDIDHDPGAYEKVLAWTGYESVPTLVIADDDSFDPIEPPDPLGPDRGPRGIDRGSMLTEPQRGQIEEFLRRHEISFCGPGGTDDTLTAAEIEFPTGRRRGLLGRLFG